jgi:hypothetical protein
MMKLAQVGTAALLAGLVVGLSAPAMAFGVENVQEDPSTGFVGDIPGSAPAITVASDGESTFDPTAINAGFDISDGIVLNSSWAPDPAYASAFAAGYWEELPGTNTWVLPACNATGCENANIFEPVAKWDYTPGGGWANGTQSIAISEADGSFSDLVLVANDGPGGAATITFSSDSGPAVPEPATWAMLLIGFAGIGYAVRRSHNRTAALAI